MHSNIRGKAARVSLAAIGASVLMLPSALRAQTWDGYAGNAQHTALSGVASQPLDVIHWSTPVDLSPPYNPGDGDLYIHYGSPVITAANTVIVPQTNSSTGTFQLNAFNGATGALMWNQQTSYTLPPQGQNATYDWTPPYGPTLASGNTLYYPGPGGTVYERSSLDSPGTVTPTQQAFYGTSLATYLANQAAYNADVAISTPITADKNGNIYFGYQTTNSAPGGLTNGIARISATGGGSFFPASSLQVNGSSAGMTQVVTNCAPAVTSNGATVYIAMSNGNWGNGRLVALNTTTMTPTASVALLDGQTAGNAPVTNDGTASPMIAPNGDVFMGVLDLANTSRGWMEHYSADLSQTYTPGGFGWDDTASIVPATMIPAQYRGTSTATYFIMTKYNNYADPGAGGDGHNMIAILDPTQSEIDTRNNSNTPGGEPIMKVIESILGPTPDPDFDQTNPGAVHEWCINSAVVDPATDSVLVNSEDGYLYRWDLSNDTLSQSIDITNGLGEAYTPTAIGPDGTVYAINDATLFAVGSPEPTGFALACGAFAGLALRRKRRR